MGTEVRKKSEEVRIGEIICEEKWILGKKLFPEDVGEDVSNYGRNG